jgi:hypothetical protein
VYLTTGYFGQGLSVYDCLHRNIGVHRWVGFIDIDEYVIPRIKMEFSLRAILLRSGLHSNYLFANNFVRTDCKLTGLETVVPANANISLELISGNTSEIRRARRPPYLFSPVRDVSIPPFPKRAKVILDPISTSYHAIHTPRIIENSIVLEDIGFNSSVLFMNADILWRQKYPDESRSFYQFLVEYEKRLPKNSSRVDHEMAIMRHNRWKAWDIEKKVCKLGKQVIDYTWINLWG